MERDIKLIFIAGLLSYIADIYTGPEYYTKCINSIFVNLELLAHHIINIYAHFGWLSNNKILLYGYVAAPIIVLLHWKTNRNRCFLTEDINKKCDIPANTPLRDILYFIGLKTPDNKMDNFHKLYLVVGWLVALYKLKYSNP